MLPAAIVMQLKMQHNFGILRITICKCLLLERI